ncbi:MAG: acetyl-CoA carboxylase biotin carboxyl carrier protein [Chlamydiota bacterium]
MDLKQIKELMTAMGRAGIKKLSIKEKTGYELLLERHDEQPQGHFYPPREDVPQTRFSAPIHVAAPVVTSRHHEESPIKAKEDVKVEGKYVTSPMVGTFYATSSPDDPPLVKVGDSVDENTVLCIIEAMKVMNEVKAGVSGKIAEVCVENAHPVEFATKLFRIV